jgi:hypothetical protein
LDEIPGQAARKRCNENQLSLILSLIIGMIGTIGIGGGSKDEEMAFEALEAVVGPQPPLAPTQPAK